MKDYSIFYDKFFALACEIDSVERIFVKELEELDYDRDAFTEVYNTLIDLTRIYERKEDEE